MRDTEGEREGEGGREEPHRRGVWEMIHGEREKNLQIYANFHVMPTVPKMGKIALQEGVVRSQ